jgi:hypothetical protein
MTLKFSFETDAILLLPTVIVFRNGLRVQIGIGWLCWGLLFKRGGK